MDADRKATISSKTEAALIVGTLIALLFTFVSNIYLNTPGISPFNVTVADVSVQFNTTITPSSATFGIWGLIFIWQLLLVLYCVTLLCRKCNGMPMYISPGVVPPTFFVSYIVVSIENPCWIVIWLEKNVVGAFALNLVAITTLVICLVSSCQELERSGIILEQNKYFADIWLTRILVQNGIAFYLAWVFIATSINALQALHYVTEVSMTESTFVALLVLTVVVALWFVLGIFYDRQLRYVCSHYITFLIGIYGILQNNYTPDESYEIYVLILMAVIIVLAAAKLAIIIVATIKYPIHYSRTVNEKAGYQPFVNEAFTMKY